MADKALSVDKVNGVVCISFVQPNLVDGVQIAQIGQELTAIVQGEESPRVLLNFKMVEHLSSAAMSVLIRVHKAVLEGGGQMRLANVNANIAELLRITNLDQIFKVDDSAREALENLGGVAD
ncbi:MAG: STAS domain-containing protein [Phycisphaera sp.]|nr:STAS domain-containing protein [Phycisphaera sp.]